MSSQSETLLGVPEANAIGRPLGHLIGPVPAAEVLEMTRQTHTFQGKGMCWHPPTGEALDVDVSAARLEESSEEPGCIAILARNAAESRRLERQMIHSEKLAAVGSLAAGLAHEIGTPLNVISATAEYLMLDQPRQGGARAELAAIVEETERIGGLVRELLHYTRDGPEETEPTSLVEVIQRTLTLIHLSLEKEGVSLELMLPERTPLMQANPDELHQVLVNLLLNASQAVGSGGHILIELFEDPASVSTLILKVHDDGPGLPEELRKRVFDPFFTTRSEGTGLGLSVCARIVQDHGGDIRFLDSPMGGACAELRFPTLSEEVSP
jgi:signal transduction histidine kinase